MNAGKMRSRRFWGLAIIVLVLVGLLGCTRAKPLPQGESPLAMQSPTPGQPLTALPILTLSPAATATPTPPPQSLPVSTPVPMSTYVVRAGDTAYSIAQRFGIDVETLAAANSLADPNRLAVGQELKIPAPSAPSTAAPTPGTPPVGRTYTVQPGDTVFDIANRFGTTVEALAAANNLADPTLIKIGQVLIIP